MNAVVTIDFGNSYTKVAVRKSLGDDAAPATDNGLVLDDGLNLCIPTVAAKVTRGDTVQWLYGVDTLRLGSAKEGVEVFRNWKPRFFKGLETHIDSVPADGAGPGEREGGELWRMPEEEWLEARERWGIPDEERESFERAVGRGRPVRRGGADVEALGVGFFRWLKSYLRPILKRLGIEDPDAVETRITLPSFGSHTEAERRLLGVLERAGWRTARFSAALSEPVANALGVISGGRNAIWHPVGRSGRPLGPYPHYGQMFGDSLLFGKLHQRALGRCSQRLHWIMVVDLGGYTLDFAMVGFDIDALDIPAGQLHRGRKRMATYSEPAGVIDLDRDVIRSLDPKRRAVLEDLVNAGDQTKLESFHRRLYQEQDDQMLSGEIISWEEALPPIRKFAARVARYARKFLEIEGYDRIDELILTGGGGNIGPVRDALAAELSGFGVQSIHAPATIEESEDRRLPVKIRRLDPLLVRGGTALGGSSIYFDFAEVFADRGSQPPHHLVGAGAMPEAVAV